MSAGTARNKSLGRGIYAPMRFNWNVCVSIGKADRVLTLVLRNRENKKFFSSFSEDNWFLFH